MNRSLAASALLAALASPTLLAAEVDAVVDWYRRAELGTPLSGVVREVHVVVGERVRRGQALVSLDARRYAAVLDSARARLAAAEPAHEEAKRELERTQDLYDRTLLATHELQLAEIALAQAAAERLAAQAKVREAEIDLEYARVSAPFDGVVVARSVHPGKVVVNRLQSETLVVLGDDSRLRARARVGAAQLAGLRSGDRVAVLSAGRRSEGSVEFVSLEPLAEVEGEPRYRVDVVFEAPQPTPRIGTGVRVELP